MSLNYRIAHCLPLFFQSWRMGSVVSRNGMVMLVLFGFVSSSTHTSFHHADQSLMFFFHMRKFTQIPLDLRQKSIECERTQFAARRSKDEVRFCLGCFLFRSIVSVHFLLLLFLSWTSWYLDRQIWPQCERR